FWSEPAGWETQPVEHTVRAQANKVLSAIRVRQRRSVEGSSEVGRVRPGKPPYLRPPHGLPGRTRPTPVCLTDITDRTQVIASPARRVFPVLREGLCEFKLRQAV